MGALLELSGIEIRGSGGVWRPLLPALTVPPGRRVGVIGACASGKTLLAHLLAGVADATQIRGVVRLDGRSLDDIGRRGQARRIGIVPSDPSLLFSGMHSTLGGELALSLQLLEWPAEEGGRRIAEVVRRLGLEGLVARDPFTLSGGEQARAAFATVLVKDPDLVVLDEVFAALDPAAAAEVAHILAARAADGGTVVEMHAMAPPWVADFDLCVFLTDGAPIIGAFEEVRGAVRSRCPELLPAAAQMAPVGDWDGGPARPGARRALTARAMAFRYGGGFRLGPVDLAVAPGELLALLGRNGAGKTTLLKCLALLLRAEAGKIVAYGRDGTAWPAPPARHAHRWARQVLYAFQNPDDQIYLPSVRRELAETASLAGLGSIDARVAEVAAALGLAEVLDHAPVDLPRPLRRLVTLGATLVAAPPVLLLDEPTAGLDGRQRRLLLAALRHYASGGGAVVLVSHDLPFVAELCTAALALEGGAIAAAIALAEPDPAARLERLAALAPK